MDGQGQTIKATRISRACDFCHKRNIRCTVRDDDVRCQSCIEYGRSCTYERPITKRGKKPKSTKSTLSHSARGSQSNAAVTGDRKPPLIASQAIVISLVEVYFEVVYPIFPFFHKPTLIRKISRGEHTTNNDLFAFTMAMCALVSARVQDQAIFNPAWNIDELSEVPSRKFFDAAVQACKLGEQVDQGKSFDTLRCCALLSLTAIQYGHVREMQLYLGRYHTLIAMDSLHDESNWPDDIGIVETEERRRVFWSMYTLEVFTSIIWNGVTRCREQQVNVAYPTESDDELFSDLGYSSEISSPLSMSHSPLVSWNHIRTNSWLCGWNFTTDLYRVLEHVISNSLTRKRHKRTSIDEILGEKQTIDAKAIRNSVDRLYDQLPACFKEVPQITCNPSSDRYGFQAANIIATLQLLRIILFTSGGASIEERCKIASEVVDAFTQIPVTYLRAISSPLIYHLAGIGAILGSIFEEPVSEIAYQQVRIVLLSLAQLLENLDHGIHSVESAQRLRTLVARIDGYWNESRASQSEVDADSPLQGEDSYHPSDQVEATRILPAQITSDFLEDWPWLITDSWASTN